jgi:hypothetical protein
MADFPFNAFHSRLVPGRGVRYGKGKSFGPRCILAFCLQTGDSTRNQRS